MKRLVCVACTLWLISASVAAQPGYQEKEQATSALADRLVKDFPQLSLDDIKLIVDYVKKLSSAGMKDSEAMMVGFEVMPRGKALLSIDEQKEMSGLTRQMKDTATAEERERMRALAALVREGKPISEADDKFINATMKESFLRLPVASQRRLRELYGKAIRAFLRSVE